LSATEEKQLNETKIRFRRSGIIKLVDNVLDGILYGMDAVRLTWDNTNLGTMVTDKFHYDLTDLDFSDLTNGLCEVTSRNNGLPFKTELDADVHLLTRYNPLSNRKNFVGSFMRSVMLLSYLKYYTRWDWKDLNSRHGNPSTYATYPENLDYNIPEDKKKIDSVINMVEQLKNDAAAVFPDWVKIIFDTALKSDQTNSFDRFVEAANKEMAITLHGQNLTTEVKQGSKAAASVHSSIDDLLILSDLSVIEDVFTNQYLRNDFRLNYGEPLQDYFEFVFIHEEQEDFESNSRIIQNIQSDPELKKKVPLKADEIYKKIGFTKPADGDEVI
jgi:hypothetical protein